MATRDSAFADGTPCWVDLMTNDAEASRGFYGELFGWEFEIGDADTGYYATARKDGKRAAGIFQMPMADHTPVWTTYLATGDADATADAVVRHGGTIAQPTMDVRDLGRMTIVQDPTGSTFGIWQAGTHFGTEIYNQTGAVVWNELMTRDDDAAKEFFTGVFSYTYQDMSEHMPGDMRYSIIEIDGESAGGIGSMPAEVPVQVPAHWRVYFAVDDTDATVEAARALGASVMREPVDMPYGRQADLVDPHGGSFTVIHSAMNGSD